MSICVIMFFFFFNDPATTEIYTLSLHDALPILKQAISPTAQARKRLTRREPARRGCSYEDVRRQDRKSTRLNSSHVEISYAVFCLKKKKKIKKNIGVENVQ